MSRSHVLSVVPKIEFVRETTGLDLGRAHSGILIIMSQGNEHGVLEAGVGIDRSCTKEMFRELVDSGKYEFIDFGCSHGGSVKQAAKLFDTRGCGIGVDINPEKIRLARKNGVDAINFKIQDIPEEKLFRFTVMSHFLEHVPSFTDVKKFIEKSCKISTEFVFIKQPYFDADGYLFRNGFKCFWSDWRGHPNCMSSLVFHNVLSQLRNRGLLSDFSIHARGPIDDSDDRRIHPIESPIDQHEYDPDMHPPKRAGFRFEFPVYYELVVFVSIDSVRHEGLCSRYPCDATLFMGSS